MPLNSRPSAVETSRPLEVQDIDETHLANYLRSYSDSAVGRYFERLIVYWIRFLRGCEVVAQTKQLREGNRTVGEIDLLFRDEQGRLNHWEVACKFYLQFGGGRKPSTEYIGPNSKDTLRIKAERLREHQLPLGIRYFPEIERQVAYVKGRIFYHRHRGPKLPLPVQLATGHLSGGWIWAREVPELIGTRRLRYRILRKPFWLADEIVDCDDEALLNPTETKAFLHEHFRVRPGPILLSGFPDCPDNMAAVTEVERWFVVPNSWPLDGN